MYCTFVYKGRNTLIMLLFTYVHNQILLPSEWIFLEIAEIIHLSEEKDWQTTLAWIEPCHVKKKIPDKPETLKIILYLRVHLV